MIYFVLLSLYLVISTMPINFTSAPRTTESTSTDKSTYKSDSCIHFCLQLIIGINLNNKIKFNKDQYLLQSCKI